jgi:hypothetical protein
MQGNIYRHYLVSFIEFMKFRSVQFSFVQFSLHTSNTSFEIGSVKSNINIQVDMTNEGVSHSVALCYGRVYLYGFLCFIILAMAPYGVLWLYGFQKIVVS